MHGVSHQGKAVSETLTFGWMWSGVPHPLRLQDYLINKITRMN